MKVYISVDMEGIAGIAGVEDIEGTGGEYQRARKWMTGEANAAIKGAYEAGADEVILSDSHSLMRNLLTEELHEKVRLIRGTPRQLSMMAGLNENISAVLLVGYHAMAGTDPGVLSHTFLLSILSLKLNGLLVGECGFNAAIAGFHEVPVVFVSGDDALSNEVKAILPWTERVITKKALSWTSADSLTPKESQYRIRFGVKKALSQLETKKPLILETPIKCEIEFDQAIRASIASDIPGVSRLSNRVVGFTAEDMLQTANLFKVIANSTRGEHFI